MTIIGTDNSAESALRKKLAILGREILSLKERERSHKKEAERERGIRKSTEEINRELRKTIQELKGALRCATPQETVMENSILRERLSRSKIALAFEESTAGRYKEEIMNLQKENKRLNDEIHILKK